jgi:hypothetical protein
MAYTRITALWTGAAGLPGYTRLKFMGDLDAAGATSAAARMRTFFDAIKSFIPQGITIGFNETAQIFNVQRELTGEVAYTVPATVTGGGIGNYAAPVGLVVNWITGSFFNGRKVRGRTFIVPASNTAFFSDGTLQSSTMSTVVTAAQALAAGTPNLGITSGNGVDTFALQNVTGASVPDRAAVLRSRRD